MAIYYVYVYYCQQNIPFYVGYGKNKRMFDHLNEAAKNPKAVPGQHKLNKIRKMLRGGFVPKIEVISSNLTKDEAIKLEIELIEKIGRSDLGLGPLTNMTRGGDGTVEWSDDLRNRLSKKRKGTIAAKDVNTGVFVQVKSDDLRWINGDLVGVNKGLKGVTNKNGALNGYILSKNIITGEIFKVKLDDPRWLSGELVGFNSGNECHENSKIGTSKRWKGVPKSEEHNKKNSEAIKLLKWYCNFETGEVRRIKENEQPPGFVRVSGPHKRLTAEQIEERKRLHKEDVIRRRTNGEQTEARSNAQKQRYIENPLLGVTDQDIEFIKKVLSMYKLKPKVPEKNSVGKTLSYERSFANQYSKNLEVSHHKVFSIISGKKNRILNVLSKEEEFREICTEIITKSQQ